MTEPEPTTERWIKCPTCIGSFFAAEGTECPECSQPDGDDLWWL